MLLTLDALLDMLNEESLREVVCFLTDIQTADMEVAITVAGW